MIICGMHLVECQGLSFSLHKTFWSIIQQGYQAQEAQFDNKWEESLEKALCAKLVKSPLGWLYWCFKLELLLPKEVAVTLT